MLAACVTWPKPRVSAKDMHPAKSVLINPFMTNPPFQSSFIWAECYLVDLQIHESDNMAKNIVSI